jgi:Tfp pilus assembly protein PilF
MSHVDPHPWNRPASPPGDARGGPPWANRLALWGIVLLVMGPVGYFWSQHEIGAWHAARGQNYLWEGDYSAALESFDTALGWAGDDANYWLLRAEALRRSERLDEALADARRAWELAPSGVVLSEYSQLLVLAGRGQEAAQEWEKLLRQAEEQDATAGRQRSLPVLRNAFAYYAALADYKLDEALVEIDKALVEFREVANNPETDGNLLDTRGFVQYRRGELDEALQDLEAAVRLVRRLQGKSEQEALTHAIDARHRARLLHESRHGLAVILYHRALVYEALRDRASEQEDQIAAAVQRARFRELAAADRAAVVQLGYTPDESLF